MDEGGHVVWYPELSDCITVGDTINASLLNAKDAKRECCASSLEDGVGKLEPKALEY